jgi:hypothetical protein
MQGSGYGLICANILAFAEGMANHKNLGQDSQYPG